MYFTSAGHEFKSSIHQPLSAFPIVDDIAFGLDAILASLESIAFCLYIVLQVLCHLFVYHHGLINVFYLGSFIVLYTCMHLLFASPKCLLRLTIVNPMIQRITQIDGHCYEKRESKYNEWRIRSRNSCRDNSELLKS